VYRRGAGSYDSSGCIRLNDPTVVALHYGLEAREGTSFQSPPPVVVNVPHFEGTLADGAFVARMTTHFPTPEEARVTVDPFLRAWELDAAIQRGRSVLKFTYVRADVADRAVNPDELAPLRVEAVDLVMLGDAATVVVTLRQYPDPPSGFATTPLLELVWARFERYREGKDSLFGMASTCLTALEKDAGDRRKAAAKFGIDFKVLSKLGHLAATRGSVEDARKFTAATQPATDEERAWIEAALCAIMKRIGETAAGVRGRLTLSALPPLP
jgi:hypothetical protein